MSFLPLDLLRDGALELGIELSDLQLELYDRFAQLLVETNKLFNLTRITEPAQIVTEHYLDSLLCVQALDIKPGARVIDVGTGAGFPGIPMKIARPDLDMTLIDSTSKKTGFVEKSAQELGLEGVTAMHARAEELGQGRGHRESYDLACARALSELKVLAELCLPLVRARGHVVAYKSSDITEELAVAKPLIGQAGGVVEKTVRARIPGTDIRRSLVVLLKTRQTPGQFPRPYAQIVRAR